MANNFKMGTVSLMDKTPGNSAILLACALGWNDVMSGKGFPRIYDGWKRVSQINYERWRALATIARRKGVATKWPSAMKQKDFLLAIGGPLGPGGFMAVRNEAPIAWYANISAAPRLDLLEM